MQSFGEFRLSLEPAALYRGDVPVRLQAQALRLLVLLASRRGELVTRNEIEKHLWRNHVVEFGAGIYVCINQIRKALDDDTDRPRYVETVARHGYRFIAQAEDPERVPVVPAGSPQSAPAPERAAAGGVPLRRRRHDLLVAATLLAMGFLTTSSTVDLMPQAAQGQGSGGTDLVLANELYANARYLSDYEQRDRVVLAQDLLKRALAMDPEHGQSHVLMADLYARFGPGTFRVKEDDLRRQLNRHLNLAERFGVDRSDLLATRGRVALYQGRRVAFAQDVARQAIAAREGNASAWRLLSETLYLQRRFDDSLEANRRAEALSVDTTAVLWDRIQIYYFAGRFDDLFALYGEVKHLQRPPSVTVGVAFELAGRHGEAFDYFVEEFRGRGIVIGDEGRFERLARSGEAATAYAWLLGEIAKNKAPRIGDKALVILHVLSGDEQGAATRLQRYVKEFQEQATGTHVDCLCALTLPFDPFFLPQGPGGDLRYALEPLRSYATVGPAPGGERTHRQS